VSRRGRDRVGSIGVRSPIRSKRTAWIALAILSIVVALAACGGGLAPEEVVVEGTLLVGTTNSGGTGEEELDGGTVTSTIEIVLEVHKSVSEVWFYLDAAADPLAILRSRPFVLLLDTTPLSDGEHTVTARTPAGQSRTMKTIAEATFVVANGSEAPPAVPTDPPNEDPGDPPAEDPSDPPADEPSDPPAVPEVGHLFVAPWGSDRADGTFEHPFRSLREAASRAAPGHVIYLRGGVYDELGLAGTAYTSVRVSGTPDAPVLIKSYPGERAIIDGGKHAYHPRQPNDGYSDSSPQLLQFVGEHTVWEDLTFRHGVGRAFYIVGNHNVFRNIVSHDHHSDGIYLQGSNNLIENCDSFNNYSISNGGNSADGLKMVNGNHIRTVFGSHAETRGNIVRGCRFWNNSDDGIDIWSSLDTLIEFTMSWSNGYGPTGNGMGYKLGNASIRHGGTVIRHSIGFANTSNNFDSNGATGITFLNNTSFAPGSIGFDLRASTAPADGSEGRNTARNNVSFSARYVASAGGAGPQPDHTHNTWNLGITDPNFASVDPASAHFLTLSADSPAIDAGIDVGLPYAGARPDLGALEVGQTVASLVRGHGTDLTSAAAQPGWATVSSH
jgi:hypothetical protein